MLGICGIVLLLRPIVVNAANDYSRVLLSGYEVIDGSFTPGENVTLSLAFQNPNKTREAYNILFTYAVDASNVLPVYGKANQVYIERLKPLEETVVEIELSIPEEISGTEAIMNYYVSYGDDTYSTYEYTASIAAPLNSECQVKIEDVFVSESSVKGDNSLISLNYSNIGTQVLENMKLHIEYAGQTEEVALDDLNAGVSEKLEHYLVFSEIGEQPITLQMSYTDQNGVPYYTDDYSCTIQVVEQSDNFENVMEISNPEGRGDLYVTNTQICIIGAFFILAVVIGLFLFGNRGKYVK